MEQNAEMVTLESLGTSEAAVNAWIGGRPLVANAEKPGKVLARVQTPRGLVVNSMLREDEWAEIDRAVVESARYPLRAVNDLRTAGLVKRLGGIGTLLAQWYVQSEMSAAEVSMTGQSNNRDLPDLALRGAPVPVVFKNFTIDARTLEASRRLGDGLDTSGATEASRVVAEKLEALLVNGASVQLNGFPLYGYTTHPNRNTDTAANFGGGDWGTLGNAEKTVAGMINAANLDYHYGPFLVYASQTQFNQAALSFWTDGSGETPADRIRKLAGVRAFNMLPNLADTGVLVVQLDRMVAEWAEALDIQVREWMSGDGMTANFKVLAVAAPAVKARFDGKSGIVHATGA